MARYALYQTGPDNDSTYPECWGTTGKSNGRLKAKANTLVELAHHVAMMDHDNWWICGSGGKCVAGSREDFYALPTIRRPTEKDISSPA